MILAKLFQREHSLFYATMWNESDRLGFKRFLDYNLGHSLFLREGADNIISEWYSEQDWSNGLKTLKEQLLERPELLRELEIYLEKI